MEEKNEWLWAVAENVMTVRNLLEASDRRAATKTAPTPRRNAERTAHLVAIGAVQLLSIAGYPAAMITLVDDAPFDLDGISFSDAALPLYMVRLAVDDWALTRFGALPGIAALRRAREIAYKKEADALRSEINPDLTEVRQMFMCLGFQEVGRRDGIPARAYMEQRLS